MRIITTAKDYSPKDLYHFTKDPAIKKMSLLKNGKPFTAVGFVLYEDVNKDGVEQEILSMQTDSGEVYATNSPTLVHDFADILSMYGGATPSDPLQVISGTSKAGREFITIRIA